MKLPGQWIQTACLLLAISGTGCGSSSSFFMIRNPFDDEARAIADLSSRSNQAPSAGETESEPGPNSLPASTTADPRRTQYFGQTPDQEPALPFLSKRDAPAEPVKPAAETAVSPPPVPLSQKETVTAPRPPSTGAVCYRCNGKGHHLTSLASDARMVECTDCGGTGRR